MACFTGGAAKAAKPPTAGALAAQPRPLPLGDGPARAGSIVQMLAGAAAVSMRAAKDAATAIRRSASAEL